MFDDPNTKEKEAQGISAVKALQIAGKEGQTIYTINQDNYSQILPKLNHNSDVMRDVRNAVNAGKEVTISERQIRAFGWSGTGFIVLDPYMGYGAYLIDGGANGGWIDFFGDNQNAIVAVLGVLSLVSLSFPMISLTVTIFTVFSAVMITMANNLSLIEAGCPDWYMSVNTVLNFLAVALGIYLGGSKGEVLFSTITGWFYTSFASSQMVKDSCVIANKYGGR